LTFDFPVELALLKFYGLDCFELAGREVNKNEKVNDEHPDVHDYLETADLGGDEANDITHIKHSQNHGHDACISSCQDRFDVVPALADESDDGDVHGLVHGDDGHEGHEGVLRFSTLFQGTCTIIIYSIPQTTIFINGSVNNAFYRGNLFVLLLR